MILLLAGIGHEALAYDFRRVGICHPVFNPLPGESQHAAHVPAAGLPHIARWHDDAPAALSLTFDDGLQCHADVAAPMLREFGLRGTFYVVPGLARQHESPIRRSPIRGCILARGAVVG